MNLYLTFIAITLAFFLFLNEAVHPKTKRDISLWLRNLNLSTKDNWPSQFNAVFDTIFTKSHLSWTCFFRSCVASLISVILLTFIWYLLRNTEFNDFLNNPEAFKRSLLLIPGIILVNFIADYISLLETRYMIKYLGDNYSIRRLWFVLIADLILTYIILMGITLFYFKFIYFEYFVTEWKPVEGIFNYLYNKKNVISSLKMGVIKTGWFSMGVLFYSAFFTSIWLWMYAIAGYLIKFINFVKKKFAASSTIFDIHKKPLLFIGFYAAIFQTIIYFIWKIITVFSLS